MRVSPDFDQAGGFSGALQLRAARLFNGPVS
jgi:hypothetical protein